MPYAAAASALWGRLGIEAFEKTQRLDPDLIRLADRVTVSLDPVLEKAFPAKFETRVTIYTGSGNKMDMQCGLPWGPENPPSDEELEEKFSYLASKVLETEQIQSWLNLFQSGIETNDAFCLLLQLLSLKLPH